MSRPKPQTTSGESELSGGLTSVKVEEDARWRGIYLRLVDFQRERGHCDVPPHSKEYRGVASWLSTQRGFAAKGQLSEWRRAALEEVGVDLSQEVEEPSRRKSREANEFAWELRYLELVAYKEVFGHTRVTRGDQHCSGLYSWRHHQREQYRQGRLSAERKAKLDKIGFEWVESDFAGHHRNEFLRQLWETRFEELSQFKRKYGHCEVVTNWSENPQLAHWMHNQRELHKKGALGQERTQRLEKLGLSWESEYLQSELRWERRYEELKSFKKRHGHCRVCKADSGKWPGLYSWRHHQREKYRQGILEPEYKARLDELGFEWEEARNGWVASLSEPSGPLLLGRTRFEAEVWLRQYEDLRRYRKKFGHCQVPGRWKENPSLSKWVQRQRTLFHSGELYPDRRKMLEELGFAWEATLIHAEVLWNKRYEELVQFQMQHGHCRVSKSYSKLWPGLYAWRHHQREVFKAGKMTGVRRKKLDALGFEWEEEKSRSKTVKSKPKEGRRLVRLVLE